MTIRAKRWSTTFVLVVLGVLAVGGPRMAEAVITIRVVSEIEGAEPIAVVPFGWFGTQPAPAARLGELVADNLARTARFAPVPFTDLPATPNDVAQVNFADWRTLGVSNLVIGSVSALPDGRFRVAFRLFNVFNARQIAGQEDVVVAADLRRAGHQISDIIYEQLTGERGAFDTRVAYVTELRRAGGERRYALNVADSDGFNSRAILESGEPILSPSWSPDGARLAYVSFEGGRARVFVQELGSGAREPVAAFPGTNSAPAWSPDGSRLAVALSKDGNPEIYVLDMSSRGLQRLTVNGAIDTEPAWSPDGQSIVYTSDRGGKPQLYRQGINGGSAARVTFEGNYNARASFSPDGGSLTFVHAVDGNYRIAVLDLETSALRVLTQTTLDESPTFAPNGRMILYATVDGGRDTLAAVSTDGRVRQQLAVQQGKVREPSWSPYRR